MRYLIAYDVTADSNRNRLAELLLDLGDRVQKSVFEVELTREELKVFLEKAAKYLQSDDSLRVYPLCAQCREGLRTCGRPPEPPPQDGVVL